MAGRIDHIATPTKAQSKSLKARMAFDIIDIHAAH
jgi:hypothetical protein